MTLSQLDTWSTDEVGVVTIPSPSGSLIRYFFLDAVSVEGKSYALLAPVQPGPPLLICRYIWDRSGNTWVRPVKDRDHTIRIQLALLGQRRHRQQLYN